MRYVYHLNFRVNPCPNTQKSLLEEFIHLFRGDQNQKISLKIIIQVKKFRLFHSTLY